MNDKRFIRIAKSLADTQRSEILNANAESPDISCGSIAERFPIGQPTVSHHLKDLLDAGIVSVRRQGQHGYIRTVPKMIEAYIEELQSRMIHPPARRPARRAPRKG